MGTRGFVAINSAGGPGGPPISGPFRAVVMPGNPRGLTNSNSVSSRPGGASAILTWADLAAGQAKAAADAQGITQAATPAPYTGYTNEPLEYPESGNIAPSTDPYGYIDPTTGDVVSSTPGTSTIDTITAWVQANPLLALGLAAAAVFLLMEAFGGTKHHRR